MPVNPGQMNGGPSKTKLNSVEFDKKIAFLEEERRREYRLLVDQLKSIDIMREDDVENSSPVTIEEFLGSIRNIIKKPEVDEAIKIDLKRRKFLGGLAAAAVATTIGASVGSTLDMAEGAFRYKISEKGKGQSSVTDYGAVGGLIGGLIGLFSSKKVFEKLWQDQEREGTVADSKTILNHVKEAFKDSDELAKFIGKYNDKVVDFFISAIGIIRLENRIEELRAESTKK